MSLPKAYQTEIQALDQQILASRPCDVVQFCADYFSSRLAAERAAFLEPTTSSSPPESLLRTPPDAPNATEMSNPFSSPFGVNANPFGGGEGAQSQSAGVIHRVIEEEENENVTSPTTPSFGLTGSAFKTPFGGDGGSDGTPSGVRSPPNPESYPAQYNFGRRTSVSAESLKPSADVNDNWSPPLHEKTTDQLQRLRKAILDNFLFSHLDEEQSAQVLGALVEKPIPAKGIKVIPPPVLATQASSSNGRAGYQPRGCR
jgi:cAMP-dependent protein kinase regulator